VLDTEGECFPDLGSARVEATASARHIVGDVLLRGERPNFGKIQICDPCGVVLDEVCFRDAVGL
jgi:hypothetical protein